jgi:hypothetical protein
VFAPEVVDLPDPWPACRSARCGSTVAIARIDAPFGPVVVTCENGHYRKYQRKGDFRGRGRYARLFSDAAVGALAPRSARERRLEPNERRCAEIVEDAERCALCGTPPAEHPYRPDLDLHSDRDVWAWFQRWRPPVYAELREAVAIVQQREQLTLGGWRLKIPAALRERVVEALEESALQADHVVPLARLAPVLDALTDGEVDFAVHQLLVAICRRCNHGRWRMSLGREDYLREYVLAVHGGDERMARADAARWQLMESVAFAAARVRLATDERSA